MNQNQESRQGEKYPENYLGCKTVGYWEEVVVSGQLTDWNVPDVLHGAAEAGIRDFFLFFWHLVSLDLANEVESNHEWEQDDHEYNHEVANVVEDFEDDENEWSNLVDQFEEIQGFQHD